MLQYIARQTVSAVFILLVVSIAAFSISHLAGDPAAVIAGENPSAEQIEQIRKTYGFDRPLYQQYLSWMGGALRFDFGTSYHYHQPVATMIAERLPVTLVLGLTSITFALMLALPLGVIAGVWPNSLIDRIALTIAVVGQAVPTFWLSLMLISFLAVGYGLLPVSGSSSWLHYVMPTIALGYYALPTLMRVTRAGMIEVLATDYIRAARAKGLLETQVLVKHALRNAIVPVVSLASVQFGMMLGGSVIVETIFAIQGIGWLGYDAVLRVDLPVVQAVVLVVAAFFIVLTWAADVVNAILDPRIRLS
ncbi:MAG TPA: ABC transporter permease [Rhizobiaceae bacterium]|nr:ABC transporter permease [Rhizobiaceae bacterium]